MYLVLLGPPGVGKGTQAARIAARYEIAAISTGDLFRAHVANGTELGRTARTYMDRGELVPDALTVAMARARITEADCARGFLLDGFPRTAPQADAVDALLTDCGARLDAAINFAADIEIIVARISGRRVCGQCKAVYHIIAEPPKIADVCDVCGAALIQRPDDTPEVVRERLRVYAEKTEPLIAYYAARGLLQTIDASADPDAVFAQVTEILDALNH